MSDSTRSGDGAPLPANPYAAPQADSRPRPSPVVLANRPVVGAKRSARQWEAHFRQRVRRHDPPAAIVQEAVAEGLEYEKAQEMVDCQVRSYRKGTVLMIVIGIAMASLASIVTIASYLDAASRSRDATFLIWWGPVVVGVAISLWGLVRLARASQ